MLLEHAVCEPKRATAGSAGFDLYAALRNPITLCPMKLVSVPTGVCIAIDPGFEAQVRPRSGLAKDHGVTVLNSPGTIDSDYRGEISVLLINFGDKDLVVNRGDRIAQLIISRVAVPEFVLCSSLSETKRGDQGFGSTGMQGCPA